MKRANGWGSVSLISKDAKKKRRKPYIVRISVLDEKTQKRKRVVIGTFRTMSEGLEALKKYEGLDIAPVSSTIPTLKELMDEALENLDEIRSASTVAGYRTAIGHLSEFWNVPFPGLSGDMLQNYFDDLISRGVKFGVLIKQKTIINEAAKIAIRRGVISQSPTEAVDLRRADTNVTLERSVFTHEEIERLWSCWRTNQFARLSLFMIYTSARLSGAYSITRDSIDFQKRTVILKETKTKAGNRVVPICDRLLPLFAEWYNEHETAFDGSYGALKTAFYKSMVASGFPHHSHDCRHTTITHLNGAVLPSGSRIDLNVIKVLCGHEVSDITRGLYNHEHWGKLVEAMQTLNDL